MTRYLFPSRVVDNENRGLPTPWRTWSKFFRRHRYAPLFRRAFMGVTLSVRDSRLKQWREKLRWWMSWETRLCTPFAHIVGTGRVNWRRCSRSSVASSRTAKYASECYARSGNARVVSPQKYPPLAPVTPCRQLHIEEAPKNNMSLLNTFLSELWVVLEWYGFSCAWLDNKKKNVCFQN